MSELGSPGMALLVRVIPMIPGGRIEVLIVNGEGIEEHDGRLTEQHHGELSIDKLESVIASWAEAGIVDVILDLEKMNWTNSTGLGKLIKLSTIVKENGGRLILMNIQERVAGILEMTKLNNVFVVVNSLEEAVTERSFNRSSPVSEVFHENGTSPRRLSAMKIFAIVWIGMIIAVILLQLKRL